MKCVITVMAIVGLVLMASMNPVDAGQLQTDYNELVSTRKSLEAKRIEYEENLKRMSTKRRQLISLLHRCVSQNWKEDFWEARLEEAKTIREKLEDDRLNIVKLRIEIDKSRRSLEKRRLQIEKTHQSKGPGTPYETEFRQYMADLKSTYFSRLESELFRKYETYLTGVEEYLAFLAGSMDICKKEDTAGQ